MAMSNPMTMIVVILFTVSGSTPTPWSGPFRDHGLVSRFSTALLYCDSAPSFSSRRGISGDSRPSILGIVQKNPRAHKNKIGTSPPPKKPAILIFFNLLVNRFLTNLVRISAFFLIFPAIAAFFFSNLVGGHKNTAIAEKREKNPEILTKLVRKRFTRLWALRGIDSRESPRCALRIAGPSKINRAQMIESAARCRGSPRLSKQCPQVYPELRSAFPARDPQTPIQFRKIPALIKIKSALHPHPQTPPPP